MMNKEMCVAFVNDDKFDWKYSFLLKYQNKKLICSSYNDGRFCFIGEWDGRKRLDT